MLRLDKMEKCSVMIALLREVCKELGLAQNSIREILDLLMLEKSNVEVKEILNTKIAMQKD